jgi:biopolymer transport protein TolR
MAMSTGGGKSGKRRPMAEINITPFTDVCLVLLIIFMVSASFMGQQRSLDVKLPSPSRDAQQDNRPVRDITLSLDRGGAITMTVSTGKAPEIRTVVTPEQLYTALEKEANTYKVQSVTIKADRGVVYKNVIQVMDTVKEAGIDYMALAVEQPAAAGQPAAPASGSAAARPSAAAHA